MNKQEQKGLVPKLRFPEFREWKPWRKIKLIDTSDKKTKWSFIGGPFGSNLKSSDYVEHGVRIIQLQNIGDGVFFNDYKIFTSIEKANELLSNNIYPGDIILSKMGDPVGRACLIPDLHDRYVMCSDGIRLVVNENENSKYFVYLLINSVFFRSLVEKSATGSTRKRIGLDELKKLPLYVPTKSEQQKIADCLASLDELILAQAQKLEALKSHKKGLMQELFPAKGKTIPKLRFPEFLEKEKWDSKLLGDLSQIVRGGSPRPIDSYITSEVNGLNWLKIADVDKQSKYVTSTKEKVLSTALNKTREVYPGDLIMSNSMSFGRPYILKIKSCIHDGWIAVTQINEQTSRDYLYYLILSPESQEYFVDNAAGSGVQNLNADIIKLLPVPLPKYSEQQKIANCLSSIDELITAQNQKIDTLKAHKKGLMQQLFPIMDEVM
ncbi:restriction endonuclease subunit S [Serratia fonticola]|uniref:restriction endonuclease subunit S n=1 Tax=Serratia fonticola TaxID=47917 RepID=UPI00055EE36F|nr:restriction endonuclease subunit S [Serratia fonticola]